MLAHSLRQNVSLYLADALPLEELEARLPDGWDLDEAADDDARRMTYQVLATIAEYDNGDLSLHELKERLQPLALWRAEVFSTSSVDRLPEAKAVVAARSSAEDTQLLVESV